MIFFIYTLGCKVNQYESEALAERFIALGNVRTETPDGADIIVVNSCSVTAESDRKTRQMVRRFRAAAPESVIVLCGCYPEGHQAEALSLKEADIIVGTSEKLSIPEKVEAYLKDRSAVRGFASVSDDSPFESMTVSSAGGRLRAVVKIEDGCNNFCSYCIIPYVRGRVRSKPESEALAEIESLVKSGVKEIVLSGIHLDRYGTDVKSASLTTLLEKIDLIEGDFRVRLSSLEPVWFTPENIDRLSRLKKLCPHFHLSLQSGSDAILARMNRRYTASEFIFAVSLIKEKIAGASVTTDVITGFPGETDEDFNQSVAVVKACKFLKVHVFPYSERPGTKAAAMDGAVPKSVRAARARLLIKEAAEVSERFIDGFIGKTAKVLIEEIKDGAALGYTENYIYTAVSGEDLKVGDVVTVTLTKRVGDTVYASI